MEHFKIKATLSSWVELYVQAFLLHFQELEHNMQEGSSALTKGLNRKAVDSFKKALDSISSSLPGVSEKVKIRDYGSYIA